MDWKYFVIGLGFFIVAYFLYRAIEGMILSNKSRMKYYETKGYVQIWAFIILSVVMGISLIVKFFGIPL